MMDARRETAPTVTRRDAYRPPAFAVDTVELDFQLAPERTQVRSRLALRRTADGPLRLDGEALELVSMTLDGEALGPNRYTLDAHGMTVADVPAAAMLEVTTRIAPASNTELSGLYTSGDAFFTQCEAEGFRRITYFPDRPDVMARYSVTVTADRARVPVLLSNGDPVAAGENADGTHWARWDDPHPKPSYLFAVVAGDLVAVSDRFTTRSGRDVALNIWVRRGDEGSCGHAMRSLIAAMRWDEQTYGLEYDLSVYNIAAVSDFNMGAMENKGLNVFNTKYVLARPDTATDGDYEGIETVIAHEYFHNWTGNRVTCRDWFQLTLKEGLTVYRDQEFSADQGSRAVKRLRDVRGLRAGQFSEDAGPLRHPVRPDSYVAIDNFYTATVYQKGAEVVRMIETRIGKQAFARGLTLYIQRHDNSAATLEDFLGAMRDASGDPLDDFERWYGQAGTPELAVADGYDAGSRTYTLTLSQRIPAFPDAAPLPIPVALALVLPDGTVRDARLHVLNGASEMLTFKDVPTAPVPSLLRGFSAPVKLTGLTPERLLHLAAHDTDPFVRWDSGHQAMVAAMLGMVETGARDLPENVLAVVTAALAGADADPAFAAEAMALPGEGYLADQMAVADPLAIHEVRQALRAALGARLGEALRAARARFADTGPYAPDGPAIGRRALRNVCLGYLVAAGDMAAAHAQTAAGANMTDVLTALSLISAGDGPGRTEALAAFRARWSGDALVMDKWFAIQAASARPDVLANVRALLADADFAWTAPNRVRAVLGTFAHANPRWFHDAAGAGYRFLAEAVATLDPLNPQVAARMVAPLTGWRRVDSGRAGLMRSALEGLAAGTGLSRNVRESVERGLG